MNTAANRSGTDSYAESVWWLLQHSNEINRMACTFTCYLDESGTDSDSSASVLGGLVLKMRSFFWLEQEWKACLDLHNVRWPLHMRKFKPRGKNPDQLRKFFANAVKVINDNKAFSVASFLTNEQYRRTFDGLTELSMYGASFTQIAMMNSTSAKINGYTDRIAYLLDDRNPYKHDVVDAHSFLVRNKEKYPLNVGTLGFDSDDNMAVLQAADVVAWSVRRKHASGFKEGFEPLADIFDAKHIELPYEERWMTSVADTLRANINQHEAPDED